jgi:hypothetical protein
MAASHLKKKGFSSPPKFNGIFDRIEAEAHYLPEADLNIPVRIFCRQPRWRREAKGHWEMVCNGIVSGTWMEIQSKKEMQGWLN